MIAQYGRKEGDTDRQQVQIAQLTERIVQLVEHFQTHKKDHHSRRGTAQLVGRRRRLLRYLRRVDLEGYRSLIAALDIRG